MIPKNLHSVWLGGKTTPLAERCRASWRRYAPDFTQREWGLEQTPDGWWLTRDAQRTELLTLPDYVTRALAARKWAFASDWLRFVVLAREGGVYLDSDVELVRSLSEGLAARGLDGREWCAGEYLAHGDEGYSCAALALEKESAVARAMLRGYASAAFDATMTVGDRMAVSGVRIERVEPEVFCPFDWQHHSLRTDETIGVHHYALSWIGPGRRLARWLNWHGLGGVTRVLLWLKRGLSR